MPSRPEASSEVCAVCVHVGGQEEQDTYMKTVEVSVPPLSSCSVRKTIFSSFCYRPMPHMHCLPSPCVCVCVCVCTQACKHRPLCMYVRVCLHHGSTGARGWGVVGDAEANRSFCLKSGKLFCPSFCLCGRPCCLLPASASSAVSSLPHQLREGPPHSTLLLCPSPTLRGILPAL